MIQQFANAAEQYYANGIYALAIGLIIFPLIMLASRIFSDKQQNMFPPIVITILAVCFWPLVTPIIAASLLSIVLIVLVTVVQWATLLVSKTEAFGKFAKKIRRQIRS